MVNIYKSIVSKLKEKLKKSEFKDVKIVSEEVEGTIIRPSLKVELEDITSELYNAFKTQKTISFRIYFFAKDRYNYKIDNLKMAEIFDKTFIDILKINDNFYVEINEVNIETIDTVLTCSFELTYIENIDRTEKDNIENPNEDFMENLYYKGEFN